jgi:hypothetical protein
MGTVPILTLAECQPRGKQHENHPSGAIHPANYLFTPQGPGQRLRLAVAMGR